MIQNKYFKWYYDLVHKARNRILMNDYEVHHIIPKSLGGSDAPENLIRVTYYEHFICHRMLVRFTEGLDKQKMTYALWGMSHRSGQPLNAKSYAILKLNFSKINQRTNIEKYGEEKANEISVKISESSTGRKFSVDSRKKQSDAHKGKPTWNKGLTKEFNESLKKLSDSLKGSGRSPESIERQRSTITGVSRKPHRDESKLKSSISNKNRPYFTCEHCGKTAQAGNFNRWHGQNCKKK